jgi:hypothetical protein
MCVELVFKGKRLNTNDSNISTNMTIIGNFKTTSFLLNFYQLPFPFFKQVHRG